ncbi:MAG: HDOD domain-containing protein, partial [Candidatus Sericytochromatia bacterium]|nr:HDOD domain-containing protein [Candidatus Sericytochromatia bacterium]
RCLARNPGLLPSLSVTPDPAAAVRIPITGPFGSAGTTLLEGGTLRLPVMPDTVKRLHELAAKDPKPPAEVISLLSADPALSARVMRYANSRKLGFARQITTVSQVVMLLGADKVCNLALGFGLYDSFLSGESAFSPWEFIGPHGLLTATAARLFCQVMGLEATEDEAFMAGMLHDVGRALLAQERPDIYERVVQRENDGENLLTLEKELFGTDHAVVGARAAREWALPNSLIQAIAHHHQPEDVPVGSLPAIIAAASDLAHASETKRPVPDAAREAMRQWLGIDDGALDKVIQAMIGGANPILVSLRPGTDRMGLRQRG